MHVTGKILVWLTVVLSIGAVVLSSKLLRVRNSWMKQVATLKEDNIKNAKILAEKRAELDGLRSELTRTMLGWDRYWTNVNIGLSNPAEGVVQSNNLGTNQGLGVPDRGEKPVVYLFRPVAGGRYDFVGPFQATTVYENNSALKATWGPRAGEPQSWAPGNWRVRALVPASHVDRFLDLQGKLTVSDELFAQKKHNLEIQTQLIETAQRDLKFRMDELVGTGQTPEEGGLLAAIGREEHERNEALAQVDTLRRQLKTALGNQDALIRNNVELMGKLPQPKRDVVTNVPGT